MGTLCCDWGSNIVPVFDTDGIDFCLKYEIGYCGKFIRLFPCSFKCKLLIVFSGIVCIIGSLFFSIDLYRFVGIFILDSVICATGYWKTGKILIKHL